MFVIVAGSQLRQSLKRLIEDNQLASHSTHFWAFLGNPRFYDVEAAVRQLTEDVWLTRGRKIHQGDFAIIWKAKGGTPKRGIIGFAEVLSDPSVKIPVIPDHWLDLNRIPANEPRVRVRYIRPAGVPLWEGETGNEILSELSVCRSTGGSIFRVTPEQWDAIEGLLEEEIC